MHFGPSNIALTICIIGNNVLIIEDKAHLFKSVDVQRDLTASTGENILILF